jgi:membrane fusion protein (multidrug efflux system)
MSAATIAGRNTLAPAPTAARARRSYKRPALAALGLTALLGAADYGYDWWTTGRFIETTDDAYVGGNVTQIAPHVAGFIGQILVMDNQLVRAGEPLVRLNPDDFQAALQHAEAVLQSRRAALDNLLAKRVLQSAMIAEAQQGVAAKQAQAVFAAQDAERYSALALTVAGSRQNAERALAAHQSAHAAVLASAAALQAANQQLAVIDTDIAAAKADVAQAEADLRIAQLNLGYTDIVAPITGYVGNRSAQIGAYVSTGTNLLSVVPASGLWVDANFKEDQIAHMKSGDEATIVADVLPGRTFHGRVLSLAPATGATFSVIPPENATGNFTKIVQRLPVRIALDGDAQELGLLRAGLSTTVSVDIRHPDTQPQ